MAKQRHDAGDEAPRKVRQSSRAFWLGSRLLVFAVLLVVLLYFAPLLLTSTGAWRSILASAAPELASQLKIEGLELSWLAPVQVRGIALTDASGQPLAEVPAVRSQKTLLAMGLGFLGPSHDVGVFEIEQPKVRVVLRTDGSNVEDLLAKFPKSEKKSQPMGMGLKLVKGQVELDDRVAGRQWVIENVDAEVMIGSVQQLNGRVAAVVRSLTQANVGGQVAVEIENAPPADGKSPVGNGRAKIALVGFPIEIAEGGLRRFVGDIRPAGALTLTAAGAWTDASSIELLVEQVASPGLSVAAPDVLTSDRPAIAIRAGKADLRLVGKQITLKELVLDSSLLQAKGAGAAGEGGLAGANAEVMAQINLAEVARQLPATLRLKQDTQLHSGVVDVSLATSSASGSRSLEAKLKTRDLRGVAAGREVRFDQPLEVDIKVRQTPQGPVIDQLVGTASFLRLEGRGSLTDGGIQAEADLNKLVAELGRLVDWGETRLAGRLESKVRWQHDAASGWTANADLAVADFEAMAPSLAPWKEPSLRLAANVRGDLGEGRIEQVRAAQVIVEAGADRLEAELTQAVRTPSASSVWPAKFSMRGDLASWTPRLQLVMPLGGWRLAGGITASGNLRVSKKEAEFSGTTLELAQLAIDGPGVAVREPKVRLETAGAWSQEKTTLTLGSTTLASSAVAFRADGVRATAGKEPSLVGTIDFRGDLGRLTEWLASPQPRQAQMVGGLTGRVDIGYRGQALAATWNCDLENFKYLVAPPAPRGRTALASTQAGGQWQPLWEEARVQFGGQGAFDPAAGTLKIERTSLATATANLAATGMVSKLGKQPEVDLSGEVAYDLGLLTREIQNRARVQGASGSAELPYGLDTLQLAGKQRRQFVLKGPVFAATGAVSTSGSTGEIIPTTATTGRGFALSELLTGEASLGWESAQYVGLVAGPADFRARLGGGIVSVGPLDIPLAEGRLTTAPRVLLNDPLLMVAIDRGPLLSNVRISPEMCSLWLKYVAPLVADATRAEGRFSLSLEGANVPLAAPLTSDMAGTLAIQSAQIGPGPLAQQYLGVANQLRGLIKSGLGGTGETPGAPSADAASAASQVDGWVVLPQQDVLFEVRDGVVVNRGMKMTVGDVVITTEGSVEVQTQKINLVASVPLNDEWFKNQQGMFAALKGQTIKIPIDGTLTQPRLDMRALQNLGKQLAGAAVQGVLGRQLERGQGALNRELERGQGLLQSELGQGLNRLFGPLGQQPAGPTQPPRQPAPR